MGLHRCERCRRHHRLDEVVCPFCRAARAAGAVAIGLSALGLAGCPQRDPEPGPAAGVYGAPPPGLEVPSTPAEIDSQTPTTASGD